ncbi:MAG: WHG domain-containing protein [Anaerolinea sp.]|nr:WHG domain-containing protein [Anaerolinea sp.]
MVKHRRLNPDRVIAQAVGMADEAGSVTAVSLTALAQALDIRPPSLYNHVASLEDLQHGMALYSLRQLVADLRQASQGLVGREALFAIANAYRRFATDHPGIYPLTIRAPEPDDAALAALAQELVQLLLLVMTTIGLHGADALHAIRGLRAILHGFTSLEAAQGYKMPLDQEESFRRLVNTYLDGLVAK